MKLLSTVTLLILTNFTFGQFAIIKDKDSFCNVRSSANKGNNIVDKLRNGDIVYFMSEENNWINIDYKKNNEILNGYVYKDRISLVSSFSKIPILKEDSNKVVLKKDSFQITLTTKKFDQSKHKFKYNQEASKSIILIDNNDYWGKDGGYPTIEYKSIELKVGGTKVLLPKNAFFNLYEPNLFRTEVNYDKQNDIFYIQSMNSDGAGAYDVIWKIEKRVYQERYIFNGF